MTIFCMTSALLQKLACQFLNKYTCHMKNCHMAPSTRANKTCHRKNCHRKLLVELRLYARKPIVPSPHPERSHIAKGSRIHMQNRCAKCEIRIYVEFSLLEDENCLWASIMLGSFSCAISLFSKYGTLYFLIVIWVQPFWYKLRAVVNTFAYKV